MRDRGWIFCGLLMFAARCSPFRSGTCVAGRTRPAQPESVLPASEKQCVAPLGYMRASHMQMLLDWREDVVRRGDRRILRIQRQGLREEPDATCLGCHRQGRVSVTAATNTPAFPVRTAGIATADPRGHGRQERAMKITRKDFLRYRFVAAGGRSYASRCARLARVELRRGAAASQPGGWAW